MFRHIFNLTLVTIMFFAASTSLLSREYPPGEGEGVWVKFRYTVNITDINGNPKANFPVRLLAYYTLQDPPDVWSDHAIDDGYTDSNGHVVLECWAEVTDYWPNDYFFDDMRLILLDSDYDFHPTDNTRSVFPTASGSFVVVSDKNFNNIYDGWDRELAKKFCPILYLHAMDLGVRPVPVEIFDRNADNKLDWGDIVVDLYTISGNYVGAFSSDRIWIPDAPLHYLYPYGFTPFSHSVVKLNRNGDGCYSCTGDNFAPQEAIYVPHFEWGNVGETDPDWWYPYWDNKMLEHSNDSEYQNGTTYVHIFKEYENRYVIQYWFFYPFNASANRHEGDWEHINVIVDDPNPQNAQIDRVVYYYHEKRLNKTNPPLFNSTHPKVYVGGYTQGLLPHALNGHGTHGSYPSPGTWNNINQIGTDEEVGGDGLVIDFDNFENIILLPHTFLQSNLNQVPYIDENGRDLTWVRVRALWGHPESTPSSGDWEFNLVDDFFQAFSFGVIDIGENPGNIAPVGPMQKPQWNVSGYFVNPFWEN